MIGILNRIDEKLVPNRIHNDSTGKDPVKLNPKSTTSELDTPFLDPYNFCYIHHIILCLNS